MRRIIAHLLRGVALLLAVAVTIAGADVVPAADIVTLAPSMVNGPSPCNIQGETTLDQVITAGAQRIPFVIPLGRVFVITGLSWFNTGVALGSPAAVQIRLVNPGVDQDVVLTVPTSSTGMAAAATTHPGILVGSGVAICAMERTAQGSSEAGLQVRVYGYVSKLRVLSSPPGGRP